MSIIQRKGGVMLLRGKVQVHRGSVSGTPPCSWGVRLREFFT